MINNSKKERSFLREFMLALMCAVWSGFGFAFAFMYAGNFL